MPAFDPTRNAMHRAMRMDETTLVQQLLEETRWSDDSLAKIQSQARLWVEDVRRARSQSGGVDAFLAEYDLSSEEGIALMCVAESFLRIPDGATVRDLIRDKLGEVDWKTHQGQSHSWFVNSATWGLVITGKILSLGSPKQTRSHLWNRLRGLVERSGLPFIQKAVEQAMKLLSDQFVMGKNIHDALKRSEEQKKEGYSHSFDMLGESARTAEDAERYFQAYLEAIRTIGNHAKSEEALSGPGISVKISALHPRYEASQRERTLAIVADRVLALVLEARKFQVGFTLDAEESERLDLSLDIVEHVLKHPALKDWNGFGLAVQAYQKRAVFVLDWLIARLRTSQQKITVRLVKGAYWDSEIKRTQEQGLEGFAVFTRKTATDVSYLACARRLLAARDCIYPQFATHNAFTVAAILELAGNREGFEFQCLHGMGLTLYRHIVGEKGLHCPCRIYSPVGSYQDLLPYLVRRLLENGAVSSFVNCIINEAISIDTIVADPVAQLASEDLKPHPRIPIPAALFSDRKNSLGFDFSHPLHLQNLDRELEAFARKTFEAFPFVNTTLDFDRLKKISIKSPACNEKLVGTCFEADPALVQQAFEDSLEAYKTWKKNALRVSGCVLRKSSRTSRRT